MVLYGFVLFEEMVHQLLMPPAVLHASGDWDPRDLP